MINATQKEGIRYLEHCKLIVNDERLSIIRKEESIEKFYSIPYFNLCVILLGEGTSITQKAAKFLAKEGVLLGFVGSGGTPLFLASQSEYRPTHYFNKFIKLWNDENLRLIIAKKFQEKRILYLLKNWEILFQNKFSNEIKKISEDYINKVNDSKNQNELLLNEAHYTKFLYNILKKHYDLEFSRIHQKRKDIYNSNLDDGNYLAYGLASICLWTLGIPPSMSVLHGKTRNGGLVFDLADIIKDGIILPSSFIGAEYSLTSSEQRKFFIDNLDKYKSLEYLFNCFIEIIMEIE